MDDSPKMERPSVPEADRRIGVRIPVLSHGYVVLVDYMGADSAIVQAARVSYGQGTKSVRDDRGLIRYLMRHHHTTPFEMVEIKFLIRLPIYVARQMVRHRTASINEYSARYSVVPEEFDLPPVEEIREQSRANRQGRGEALPAGVAEEFRSDLDRVSQDAYRAYQRALSAGVARETARLILPLSYYTEWYWKVDLWNLFHFLSLRLDPHAQEEIRKYAAAMAEIVRTICPIAYEAFEDFSIEGIALTGPERVALRALLEGSSPEAACERAHLPLKREDGQPMRSGEGVEFLAKLDRIRASTHRARAE
ncbi:MAG TPA: FAD-dependent thymidylate synthase [Thermoplasmata archaeon]|nr:FAD-dependent thymidylate synthase [Thermoplasmata archaeon]